jgi:chromosome segregation ATPase
MTQAPVTVTYSLEEILGQINQKLDKIDDRFDTIEKEITEIKIGQTKLEGEMKTLSTEVKGEMKTLSTELKGEMKTLSTELKGEMKTLSTEVKGIGKRLDTQEFINRSVVVGFCLSINRRRNQIIFS